MKDNIGSFLSVGDTVAFTYVWLNQSDKNYGTMLYGKIVSFDNTDYHGPCIKIREFYPFVSEWLTWRKPSDCWKVNSL